MEILKSLVSEEELKEIVIEKVEEAIEEIITYEFNRTIKNKIETITEDKTNEILDKEIDKILKGEIIIIDGWGNKKRYDSFEDMFKKEVIEQLESYHFKKTVETLIKSKIENIFKNKLSGIHELIEKILLEKFNLGGM